MLSLTELKARIDRISYDAIGSEDNELSNERAEALDRYHGRPYGDEIEGRSQIVTKDLAERVDWMLPQVINVFLQSGSICEFDPVGPEDEEAAKQEADYINHVIMKRNNGFLVLYDWFKDALLMKNSYCKVWWDESEEITFDEQQGLDADTLTALLIHLGDEAEVVSQDEIELDGITLYDVKLKITSKKGRIRVEAVPAEEVRISKLCRGDLDDSPLVEHRTRKTRTELIGMGMDKDFVDSLPSFDYDENDQEQDARDSLFNEREEFQTIDRSMDMVLYRECYVKVDYDEDGVAELRRVVIVGEQIPEGDEWNREIEDQAFCYLTPKRMPHRHIGESLNDEIEDLAEVKTVLERNMLDNTYGLNNVEYLINENVNLDDFLTTKPLGIKRVEGRGPVDGSARAVEKPNILQHILPVIEYYDGAMDRRSGVKPGDIDLDPNQLQEVRQDVYNGNESKKSTKSELIARLFAEQGIKPLIQKVHKLCRNYQVKQDIVKLRGKYVVVDPREWKERDDMTVNVGLGTGTEEVRMRRTGILAQSQDRLAQFGLVGPREAYNVFVDTVESLGYPSASKYAIDPMSPEYQQMMANRQPPQNPLAEVEQIKQQGALKREQIKESAANARKNAELMADREKYFKTLDDQAKQQKLEKEQAKHEITEAMNKLTYDEQVFNLKEQLAKLEDQYRDTIAEAQNQVVQIQNETESQRLEDREALIDKIVELNQAIGEIQEKSRQDDEAKSQALTTLINELNRPRKVLKDDEGEIIGLE